MTRAFLAATALLLSACATAPSAVPSGDHLSDDAKLFADFLAGTYASNVEDASARASYYSRAFAQVPDNSVIGRRALSFALLDGDLDTARAIATDLLQADPKEPMARLVLGQRAFVRRRPDEALDYFEDPTADIAMGTAMDILAGWATLEDGTLAAAERRFARIDRPGLDPLRQMLEVQATLQAADMGRVRSADIDTRLEGQLDVLDAIEATGFFATEAVLTRADILVRLDRRAEAIEVLEVAVDESGNQETGPVANRLAALLAGETPDTTRTLLERASDGMVLPSYAIFARAGSFDAAEIYLRLALDLDPGNDLAKILLGNILDTSKRADEALALYQSIGEDSDYLVSGRLAESNVHLTREDDAKALAVLEEVARLRPSVVTREALGRARLIRENYAEALPIYEALIAGLSEDQLRADPNPLFLRGVTLVELNRFPDAVRDFRRVLEIDPDNAEALNYLGYSWVDRGENLQEAFDMIERAVELEPDSGAITDSLGWAHYKLGNYAEARIHLERAAELSPASATIIDHLGDVYWKLGRFREAGYQWSRALDLDPTDEERAEIRRKLRTGLDGASPAP